MQGFLFWSRSPALEQIRTIISRLGGMAGQEGQICRPVLPEGKKGTRVARNVAVQSWKFCEKTTPLFNKKVFTEPDQR